MVQRLACATPNGGWPRPPTRMAGRTPRRVAPIVADEAEFRRLPAAIAVYRAAQAHLRGDVDRTKAHAARALELIGPDDHLGRGSAAGLLALAHWTTGDLDAAHGAWTDAMTNLEAAGHLADAVGCAIALADIRIEQGRLRDAFLTYERGLRLATEHRPIALRGAADMHVGMSERFLERDDLDAAVQHLVISKEMGEHLGSRQNPYRWCVAMARMRAAEGDPARCARPARRRRAAVCRRLLPEGPADRRVAGTRVDRSGNVGRRARLGRGPKACRPKTIWSTSATFEHITLARLLLAESKRDQAGAIAVRGVGTARPPARGGGRRREDGRRHRDPGAAGACPPDAWGRRGSSRRRLNAPSSSPNPRATSASSSMEARRWPPCWSHCATARSSSSYVRELLTSFGRGVRRAPTDQDLVEPLSGRELEVLRLLATDLDGPGIARELVVSLSTIRSHTKAIYAKLGVTSRRAAVRRGEELGLMSRSDRPRDRATRDA